MDQSPSPNFICQQALEAEEKKVHNLTQKLNASLEALINKDAMVNQHAKIAEEAVAGWEAVQIEMSGLKKELEVSLQQRDLAESRVSHLEEALKECMKQMRHAQEQQQERMEQAMNCKSLEWNRVKCELEGVVSELDQRLMEAQAQNTAMAKSLQERARAILECQEAKARVETEASLQQVKVEALEKEVGGLKYELYMQSKELEILSKEKEESSKAAEAAYKQNLDHTKKIGKLEADCDRLRTLVRKRLPGPADFAQMKMEVDASLRRDSHSKRRRPAGLLHGNVASSPTSPLESHRYIIHANISDHSKDMELMESKLLFLEEESRMLKEILARRATEVQSPNQKDEAKVYVAVPPHASETKNLVMDRFLLQSKSVVTGSSSEKLDDDDDEVSCSGSWASALISELDHFKNSATLEKSNGHDRARPRSRLRLKFSEEDRRTLKTLASRDAELQSANLMCKDATTKLSSAVNILEKSDIDPNVSSLVAEAHEIMLRLDRILDEMRIAVASIGDTSDEDCDNSSPSTTIINEIHEEISLPVTQARSLLSDVAVENAKDVALSEVSSNETAQVNETENQNKNVTERVDVKKTEDCKQLCEQKCENVDLGFNESLGVDIGENEIVDGKEREIQQQLVVADDVKESEILQQLYDTQKELKLAKLELADAKVIIDELETRMLDLRQDKERLLVDNMREMQVKAEAQVKMLESKVASLTLELENREKEHQDMIAKYTMLEAKIEEHRKEAERMNACIVEAQEAHATKEREIAGAKENLEDCQRTILVLGKQLSALTDASESFNSSMSINCNHEGFVHSTSTTKNPDHGGFDLNTPRIKSLTQKGSRSFNSCVPINCNLECLGQNTLTTNNLYHGESDLNSPKSTISTHGGFNLNTTITKSSRFNSNLPSANCNHGVLNHNTLSINHNHENSDHGMPSMNYNNFGYAQNASSMKCGNNDRYAHNTSSKKYAHDGFDQKNVEGLVRSKMTHHHSRSFVHGGSVDLSSSQRIESRINHGHHRRMCSEAEVRCAIEGSGMRNVQNKYSIGEHMRMGDDGSENIYISYSTESSPSVSPSQDTIGGRRNPDVNLSVRTSLRKSMAVTSSSSSTSMTSTTPRGGMMSNNHHTTGFSRFFNRTKK